MDHIHDANQAPHHSKHSGVSHIWVDIRCLRCPQTGHQLFGLYATTGRAVSFLAPSLFGLFVSLFDAQRAGIVGIVLVLVAGLLALWPVRPPSVAAQTG
jgi:hypothetical protein